MEFLKELPNTEHVFDASVQDLLDILKQGAADSVSLVASGLWFDYESPDYSHFEAYEAAFDKIAGEIKKSTGEAATRQQGFDGETFEPVPLLGDNDIFADFFYHWPGQKLILFYAHEDKELPIDIAIMRLR